MTKMASKVHKVRFYNPKPKPINCASFNDVKKVIAIARNDASIEIWDLNHAPFLMRYIPGVENGSVEALGWVGDRLLSTGLGGALIEWDIARLCQRTTVLLTGYAAWCLDVSSANYLVAVGTEQGYINLYSVDNDEIVYKKLFDKQEGRIMCCKFDRTGNILVTGSVGSIRVWNVETGHAMTRISVSRRTKEVMVWSIAVLSDNVFVSGDSHGRLTFWDGALGEQIESYTTHKADILSIAVSKDEQNIFCSGMDPTISHFVKVNMSNGQKSSNQWVKNVKRHIHEHDVRSLVIHGDKLVSVGDDGYLTFSSYPPKWVMRVPPMMPSPRSSVCSKKKLLLLRYSNHLEVWKLGSYATKNCGDVIFNNVSTDKDSDKNEQYIGNIKEIEQDAAVVAVNGSDDHKENRSLQLTESPVKLVSIQTKHKKQIQCCTLSPSGEFIVYATDTDVRMLKLETDDTDDDQSSISVSKVLITGLSSACDHVAFTEDSRVMVAHCGGVLQVLQVDPEAGATVIHTIQLNKHLKTKGILHLLVSKKTSSGATYLVIVDTSGVIEVKIEKKRRFLHHITLPRHHALPSAITVDSARGNLIIVYTDQKVMEYDLALKKFVEWPELSTQWRSRRSAFAGVCAHPRRDALVFRDDTSLWVLDRNPQIEEEEPEAKRGPRASTRLALHIVPVKYLADFHWVGDDEAVMLEVLPKSIVSQLPPPVRVNNWHIRP